jgi:hypothetical protein
MHDRVGRILWVCVAMGIALTVAPAVANAHGVVWPKQSAPGAYERYSLRVPNERDVPTTEVEIHFPQGMRIESFEDVPGWQLRILTDSAKAIVGAVWTGSLAPQRFVEFPFVAANPKSSTRVAWPAIQTYASGERVEFTGPEASITVIKRAGPGAAFWLASVALLLSLISLGLLLQRPRLSPNPM